MVITPNDLFKHISIAVLKLDGIVNFYCIGTTGMDEEENRIELEFEMNTPRAHVDIPIEVIVTNANTTLGVDCARIDSTPHFEAICAVIINEKTKSIEVVILYNSLLPPTEEYPIRNAQEELSQWVKGK